jgi:hypothetical protein
MLRGLLYQGNEPPGYSLLWLHSGLARRLLYFLWGVLWRFKVYGIRHWIGWLARGLLCLQRGGV